MLAVKTKTLLFSALEHPLNTPFELFIIQEGCNVTQGWGGMGSGRSWLHVAVSPCPHCRVFCWTPLVLSSLQLHCLVGIILSVSAPLKSAPWHQFLFALGDTQVLRKDANLSWHRSPGIKSSPRSMDTINVFSWQCCRIQLLKCVKNFISSGNVLWRSETSFGLDRWKSPGWLHGAERCPC